MATIGYKELDRKLRKLGESAGGKILRSAAMTAMLPALKAVQAAAPIGNPPYFQEARISTGAKTAGRRESARMKNPYPVKDWRGRYRGPGFLSRHISRKSFLGRDKRSAQVILAPRAEAFYGVNYLEFGKSGFPKRPWFVPAFQSSIPAVDKRFRKQLKRRLDKAAR